VFGQSWIGAADPLEVYCQHPRPDVDLPRATGRFSTLAILQSVQATRVLPDRSAGCGGVTGNLAGSAGGVLTPNQDRGHALDTGVTLLTVAMSAVGSDAARLAAGN
jgi:hypothetical protein